MGSTPVSDNSKLRQLVSFARRNSRVSPVVITMIKCSDPFYKSARWLTLRQRILKRDEFLCQLSLRYGKRRDAQMVHHIWPRDRFPQYQYCAWNLISLTNKEHDKLHDRVTGGLTAAGEALRTRTPPPSNDVDTCFGDR